MPDPRRFYATAGALLAAALLCPFSQALAQEAAAYAVMDGDSGHVLMAQNSGKRLTVGSLTDIATAMVVLDWLEARKHDINEMVPIPPEAMSLPQNPIGFQQGDQASIRDLLYATLLQSDDIAASALAMRVGQDLTPTTADETPIQCFVAQMNALARKLGMRNTIFVNPTGLDSDERRQPYSTAYDMALLTRYAMDRSQFRFYVSQKERQISIDHFTIAPSDYELENTNEMLGIDAIDGVRTGMSRRTGGCVILSAAHPPESVPYGTGYIITPRRLVVVVLGADNRFDVAHQLLQSGWQAYDQWAAAGRPTRRL